MNRPDLVPAAKGHINRSKRLFSAILEWANRNETVLAILILLLSCLPFSWVLDDPPHSDVDLYHAVASDISAGKLPYRDTLLEYPPYAIPLFLLPKSLGDENYSMCFKLLGVIADIIIKCLLFTVGLREAKGIRSLLPLTFYCLSVPFIRYFFLQRYDVFPAAISLLALWLFCSRNYALSGLMIALGAGLKLYPVLFVLPLFILAWHKDKGRQFLVGLIGGGIPMFLLGFFLPWWRFFAFHTGRGLQAESLSASIVWLAHLLGIGDGKWEWGTRCFEVHGETAKSILPWSRVLFVSAVGLSTLVSCWGAARCQKSSAPHLARILLVPLLAFVVFNQVFSPQFMIWLLPLASIASLGGNPWITAAIALATMLTPIFYPSAEYFGGGLNALQTLILVVRNLILVWVWGYLIHELLRPAWFARAT